MRTFVHFLLAALVTVPLAFVFLFWYRRSIRRFMGEAAEFPPELPASASSGTRPPIRCRFSNISDSAPPTSEAMHLVKQARRGTRATGLLYAVSGLIHAIATTTIYYTFGNYDFGFTTLIAFFLVLIWPTALIAGEVAFASRRLRWAIPLCLTLAIALLSGRLHLSLMWTMWLLYVLVPLILILAVTNRRYRTAGMLIFPAVFVIFSASRHIWISTTSWIFVVGVLLGSALLVLGLLRLLSELFQRNKLSELEMMLDVSWFLLTLWQAFGLNVLTEKSIWIGFIPFLLYKLSVFVGKLLMRKRDRQPERKLMLLRTFGARVRSERLLDELSANWRYLGSIQLIGAPDVAASVVDPDDFLALVTGRLRGRFVKSLGEVDLRLAELSSRTGSDRRFPINKFYCFDRIWREVVIRLVDDCDVVLMDLRGFNANKKGCVKELRLLFDRISLKKIIFLTDRTTNNDDLKIAVKNVWQDLKPSSPNYQTSVVDFFHVTSGGPGTVLKILERLCQAAANP